MSQQTFQIAPGRALKQLARGEFESSEERDHLLVSLDGAKELKSRDLVWMLFRPDRAIREKGSELLRRCADLGVVDLFLAECRRKPPAVLRAAPGILFHLRIPGVAKRLAEIAVSSDEPNQDVARKVLAEAPVTQGLAPMLWQLATTGETKERLPFLERLAAYDLDDDAVRRWLRVAEEDDPGLQRQALAVLAEQAPAAAVDLFVEELPRVDYDTQQRLIAALTRIAGTQGIDFVDRILPLLATAEARTRTAVLKILVGMKDRAAVVRRSLVFSKTLAGWARDRALESMKAFGDDLVEPAVELLADDDPDVRALAVVVASAFEDPRVVPAMIPMLEDEDWWIRITAADSLGQIGDRRATPALVAALKDPEVRWAAAEALGRLGDPESLRPLAEMLRDRDPDIRIEVLLAMRRFDHPGVMKVVEQVARADPNRAVRSRALEIAEELARKQSASSAETAELEAEALKASVESGAPRLHGLLVAARNDGASDLHLSVAEPPLQRLHADLVRTEGEALSASDTESMLREILTEEQWQRLGEHGYLDFCHYVPDAGRYRGNVFLDRLGYEAVFRVIPEKPPTITDIGLPAHLAEIADYQQGLVLICGPGGSGKSTTQAALVNLLNESRHSHILTLEDPVEFVHPFKSSLVNQREVGSHTESFARALRAALREDPDVIMIGDLRDPESVSMALTAAETGHIVLATMSATSSAKAIDRIISSFPADEQPQIQTSLAECLAFVVAQRLLPAKDGSGRVACFEVLRGTLSVANLIRDGETHQIQSALQIGRSSGMQSFDDALRDLAKREEISPETAFMAAQKKDEFEALVSSEFLERASFL